MSLFTSRHLLPRRFRLVLDSFLQHDDLAFADVLPEAEIQAAFDAHDANFAQEDGDIYTPQVASWAALSQTLFKEEQRSCVAAVARVVVLTDVILDMGPYRGKETGETALFRKLLKHFVPGDIFVADRYMCSYFMITLAMALGVDCVVRQHQMRTTDFRRGRRLGNGDHIVRWGRPQRPEWMDEETYQRMPESIEARGVGYPFHQGNDGHRQTSL